MTTKTLDQYREEYKQKKLITMPIAGTIIWLCLGIMALFVPAQTMVLPVYIGTGSIFYLAFFYLNLPVKNSSSKKKNVIRLTAYFFTR